MVFPEDILHVAEKLEDHESKEVVGRMIVDRAYYSAYHKAMTSSKIQNLLVTENEKEINYEKLTTFCKKFGDNECKVISQILADLRRRRNQADYDIYTDFDIYNGKEAVIRAKEIFKLC